MWHILESQRHGVARRPRTRFKWRRPDIIPSKWVEIGLTTVGVVVDAVNLPPVPGVACGVGLAVSAAVARWALRVSGAGRRRVGSSAAPGGELC